MTAKISGLFLIAFCSAAAGFFFAARFGSRLRQWEGFLRLIRQIEARISGYSSPLSDIYADFSDWELDLCGFSEELRRGGLASALELCTGIDRRGEGFAVMQSFAAQLGCGGVEEQLTHCRFYGEKMQEAVIALRQKRPQTTRLCFSVCGAIGLSLDLLLL